MSELPEGARGRVLAAAILVTALAGIWAGVVVPALDWYGQRTEKLEQQTTLARRMAQVAAELPDLRSRVERPEAAAPVAMLEGNSDAVAGAALQQRLQTLASSSGATVGSTEVLPGEQVGRYRRVGVRMSLNAPWPVIVHLVDAITTGSPRLLIDDLQIQGARAPLTDTEPSLTTSMVVFGFRPGSSS